MLTNSCYDTMPNNNRKTLNAIANRLKLDRLEKAEFHYSSMIRGCRSLMTKGYEIKPDWKVLKLRKSSHNYEVLGNLNEYRIELHGDFGDGMMPRVAHAVSQFATIVREHDSYITFRIG